MRNGERSANVSKALVQQRKVKMTINFVLLFICLPLPPLHCACPTTKVIAIELLHKRQYKKRSSVSNGDKTWVLLMKPCSGHTCWTKLYLI